MKAIISSLSLFLLLTPRHDVLVVVGGFTTRSHTITSMPRSVSSSPSHHHCLFRDDDNTGANQNIVVEEAAADLLGKKITSALVGGLFMVSTLFCVVPDVAVAAAAATTTTVTNAQKYDGFAEYAKENKMEQSDVGCFINKCGDQTKDLFANPRGIKGVSCLGRCKGEQTCSVRCFAEFGSDSLSNWLSCAIEEQGCVKVPKNNLDNSKDDIGYATTVKNFNPKSLEGKWYKNYGLSPNYDLFDCQYNSFKIIDEEGEDNQQQGLDMSIYLRVARPQGGFWENNIYEEMVVDSQQAAASRDVSGGEEEATRTMHTVGKMNGLKFLENWFILGESDGKGGIPEFKLVAYRGHTLQGGYEGSFVYSRESVLPENTIPAIREAAKKAGLNFDEYAQIDNTCPTTEAALNDAKAGTGTSTADWINLVVGEGGVIDWISPGWRGEYDK